MSNLLSTEDTATEVGVVDHLPLPLEINHQLADESNRKQVFAHIDLARKNIREGNILHASGVDDFSVLLMYAYGVQEDQYAQLGAEGVRKLESGIKKLQAKRTPDEVITATVKRAIHRFLQGESSPNKSAPKTAHEIINYPKPALGAELICQDTRGYFLHSFKKFVGYALPTYLVYTDDGGIEEWSPMDIEVGAGSCMPNVYLKAFPIGQEVTLVKSMIPRKFPKARAKIAEVKVENGVLQILVRHREDKKYKDDDRVIEDWISPDKISCFGDR